MTNETPPQLPGLSGSNIYYVFIVCRESYETGTVHNNPTYNHPALVTFESAPACHLQVIMSLALSILQFELKLHRFLGMPAHNAFQTGRPCFSTCIPFFFNPEFQLQEPFVIASGKKMRVYCQCQKDMERTRGPLMVGPQCRLSILRNGNVPSHFCFINFPVDLLKKSPMWPVNFKKWQCPMSPFFKRSCRF